MASHVAKTAIAAGREHYTGKQYKPALEKFTRAMKACSCTRGMKRERCSCKNYEAVAANDGSIFDEAMYNCTCPVGKTFNKCDSTLHIQALDYRAATFEALKELDRARKDAEWMIELAPRLPDGYLRLGKILRLQKKQEYAWKVYCAGIQACRGEFSTRPEKLQQLYAARQPLHVRFSRKDPLILPNEICQWIFLRMDFPTLVRCLRVSKSWRRALTARGNERLWRSLLFTGNYATKHAPSLGSIQKLLSYSAHDVRELVVQDAQRFRLTSSKLIGLLRGAKRLRRLEIRNINEDFQPPQAAIEVCRHLEELTIAQCPTTAVAPHSGFPLWLMSYCADSLVTVHFAEDILPYQLAHMSQVSQVHLAWPERFRLSNLRHLRLNADQNTMVPLIHMSYATPALEQLWLDNFEFRSVFMGTATLHWENLQCVTLRNARVHDMELGGLAALLALHGGTSLRHIDLQFASTVDGTRMSERPRMQGVSEHRSCGFWEHDSADGLGMVKTNDYANLQILRCLGLVLDSSAADSTAAFRIPASNGKLRSFDIYFPLDSPSQPMGQTSIAHLQGYEWLRGTTSIESLGVFQFRFRQHPNGDKDLPLPSFLASFPNLMTLEIFSSQYEEAEFCTVIAAILKAKTSIKTVYQSGVQGVRMDQLKDMASACGVDLIWGERPREWPVQLHD